MECNNTMLNFYFERLSCCIYNWRCLIQTLFQANPFQKDTFELNEWKGFVKKLFGLTNWKVDAIIICLCKVLWRIRRLKRFSHTKNKEIVCYYCVSYSIQVFSSNVHIEFFLLIKTFAISEFYQSKTLVMSLLWIKRTFPRYNLGYTSNKNCSTHIVTFLSILDKQKSNIVSICETLMVHGRHVAKPFYTIRNLCFSSTNPWRLTVCFSFRWRQWSSTYIY